MIVRWCGAQASNHNSQGVVDGGVDEANMSTAAPNTGVQYSAVGSTRLGWILKELLLQHPNWNQQAVSEAWSMMSASCEVT